MGFSEYETKAYMSLLRQGTASANDIASSADIPQSRVYDVLDSLESKGFVKVQPGRPKQFGSVKPETAIDRFCEFKRRKQTNELEEIRTLGSEFSETVDTDDVGPTSRESDICWSYPNRHYILEQLELLGEETESEILMVTSPKSFERILNHHGSLLKRKADTGVSIRALVAADRPITAPVERNAVSIMDVRRAERIQGRLYVYDATDVLLAYPVPADDGFVGISTASSHLCMTFRQLFEAQWREGTPHLET
jgi:sugar-specific transcriptional regulator TrmB